MTFPLALLAAVLLVAFPAATAAATGAAPATDRIVIADVPPGDDEDCVDDPDAVPGVGLRECPEAFNAATLLPFVAAGVGLVLAVIVGWFLVMRRRVSRPFLPDAALGAGAAGGTGSAAADGEWWTCTRCGATNLVGSARCYSCGSWQR